MNILFGLLVFSTIFVYDPPEIITGYKGQNRLILIFSQSNHDTDYEKSLNILASDPLGMDKLDIVIFEIFTVGGISPDGSAITDEDVVQLRQFYEVPFNEFKIILVDKNSRKVYESWEPIPLSQILRSFESMPE